MGNYLNEQILVMACMSERMGITHTEWVARYAAAFRALYSRIEDPTDLMWVLECKY